MKFPVIETIDPILKAIEGRKDFIHAVKDGYQVVDYLYVMPDSFDDPLRLECRGIKFDLHGEIIARPFHKFFNLGERGTTFDMNAPHWITEKLDGSMIHPAIVDNMLVFMTRMGATDVAKQPHAWLEATNLKLLGKIEDCAYGGLTPIFEWTGPQNRIVLAYDKPELTLLAMRWNVSGEYLSHDDLMDIGKTLGVPVVGQISGFSKSPELEDLTKIVRSMKDREGVVLVSHKGHRVKIKAEDYVLKHKIMADVAQERHFARLVLEGKSDDAVSIMSKDVGQKYEDWATNLRQAVVDFAVDINGSVLYGKSQGWTDKDFALQVKDYHNGVPIFADPAYFIAWRHGIDAREALTQVLLRSTNDNKKWRAVREALGLAELCYAPTLEDNR
jgi:T4 RnlA family RNA ligase